MVTLEESMLQTSEEKPASVVWNNTLQLYICQDNNFVDL